MKPAVAGLSTIRETPWEGWRNSGSWGKFFWGDLKACKSADRAQSRVNIVCHRISIHTEGCENFSTPCIIIYNPCLILYNLLVALYIVRSCLRPKTLMYVCDGHLALITPVVTVLNFFRPYYGVSNALFFTHILWWDLKFLHKYRFSKIFKLRIIDED